MSETNELDIDTLRSPSELPHHWKLRREFLNVHKGQFDHDRLISLSHLFVNIKCLGLEYPQEVMDNVEKLSKLIDTKLIEEATVEESYESRDNEINCDESKQQQHRHQHNQQSSRYNNNSNHNSSSSNNNYQSRQTSSPFGRGRPRFQQSNQHNDNRHQSYQQQNSYQQPFQSYQQQQPQEYQQQQQQQQSYQQQPQQFARYTDQPRFFRPQELRPTRADRQGLGARQSPYQPRHQRGNYRGGSGGPNWRS